MCRVAGSRQSVVARLRVDANETPVFRVYAANLGRGTAIGGQFGWGGTPLKKYQWRPKVGSIRSEIGSRVQEQKPA
jgi:hypothetical protein